MSDLPPRLERFLETLELLPERADRIHFLIDVAERFQEVAPEVATRPFESSRQVPHCESEVYVWGVPDDDRMRFQFAVENPQGISARAMAVILDETLSGEPLEAVARVPEDLPYRIFGRELSMGKSMGLTGMVAMVKAQARRHASALRPVRGK